ncbi:MAG: class I SAM-dependent methyltransferase [Armatimonadetes bacterium]|nr:class I SAM-dependent methyltransferase [Armatimonadota bacterium]
MDIGCGAGRFTYGMLSLGAFVTACDQSSSALERASELCKEFGERASFRKVDLLQWEEEESYDFAFSFGVVHHTGNTYGAIRNVGRKVKQGGKLFLMVYGFPETLQDFVELNSYEEMRERLRLLSCEEKKRALIEQFGEHEAHGWFDAVSPRINDLLTFPELAGLLTRLGFRGIRRTMNNRNHHLIAEKS